MAEWLAKIMPNVVDYSGKFLTDSDATTLMNKFICITGENADRNNPGSRYRKRRGTNQCMSGRRRTRCGTYQRDHGC